LWQNINFYISSSQDFFQAFGEVAYIVLGQNLSIAMFRDYLMFQHIYLDIMHYLIFMIDGNVRKCFGFL
jgi:hypothetical protein